MNALLEHVGIYTLLFKILSPLAQGLSFVQGLEFRVITGIFHFGFDYFTGKYKQKYLNKSESKYIAVVGIDNTLHILILVGSYIYLFPDAVNHYSPLLKYQFHVQRSVFHVPRSMFRVAVSEILFLDKAGFQFSMLHPQRLMLAAQLSMLNPQRSMLNAQSSMLNPQSSMLNAQSSLLNAQSSMLNAQCSTLNAQSSMLNARCSLILYTIKVISTKLLKMSV